MPEVIDIYHGSVNKIEKPVFGEVARERACSADSDGYANHYRLNMTGLSVLNLNILEYNIQ